MRAQRVEVGDMLPPTHGGVARDGRLTATPLIEIEELAPVRQEVVLRQQIIVMCAWSAVENDHEGSGTDAAGEEPNAVAFNEHECRNYSSTARASATLFTSACSRSPNPSRTSESMSIWPRMWSPRRISTTSSDFVKALQAR